MTRTTEILRTFSGCSHLPVYECDKTNVQTLGRRVRPLRNLSTNLCFRAWRLAHAVKKADCARWPFSKNLLLGAAGFLLEHEHLFDWSSGELRLNGDMSDYYADVTRTSIAGRVAQGMALLFVEDQGYSYLGRFEAELQRYAREQPSRSTKRRSGRLPDFILENGSKRRALAEARGRFVPLGSTPDIKGALRDALDQLNSGGRLIAPQPPKSYAVGDVHTGGRGLFRRTISNRIRRSRVRWATGTLLRFRPMQSAGPTMHHGSRSWASTRRPGAFAQARAARSGTLSRLSPWEGISTSSPFASILPWHGRYIPDPDSWQFIWVVPGVASWAVPGQHQP